MNTTTKTSSKFRGISRSVPQEAAEMIKAMPYERGMYARLAAIFNCTPETIAKIHGGRPKTWEGHKPRGKMIVKFDSEEDRLEAQASFYSNVDASGDCWEWIGRTDQKGYGIFYWRGATYRAHRMAKMIDDGHSPSDPKLTHCCHRCDHPSCVRPEHLFWGTPKDNSDDMISKGRGRHLAGEAAGRAKLTEDEVLAIRAATGGRGLIASLAEAYGVDKSTIGAIRSGRRWRHVGGAIIPPETRKPRTFLTDEGKSKVEQMISEGYRLKTISELTGISHSFVARLSAERTRKITERNIAAAASAKHYREVRENRKATLFRRVKPMR